ncbi:MAG: CBS domain-containing protein [Gammaproteobacteria bacterium]|nr:CBS domain-containing protein [Gammaproteobacteria bacterium]
MAFTVYGPGIRDEVLLDKMFDSSPLEQADAVKGAPRKEEDEPAEQQEARDNIQRSQAKKAYKKVTTLPPEREPAIAAHQIMTTPVVSLPVNASIVEAWKLFRERRFRYVPVLSVTGKLIGILSDRALLRYAATTGNVPPYPSNSPQATTSIEQLVKMQVITATPDTRIREIARLMMEKHVGAMPIMDRYENLIGIITRSDILRTVVNHAPLELWV